MIKVFCFMNMYLDESVMVHRWANKQNSNQIECSFVTLPQMEWTLILNNTSPTVYVFSLSIYSVL